MGAKNPRANRLNRFGKLQDGTELSAEANGHDVLEAIREEFGFLPAGEDEFDPFFDMGADDPYEDYDEPDWDRIFHRDYLEDLYQFDVEPPRPRSYVHSD